MNQLNPQSFESWQSEALAYLTDTSYNPKVFAPINEIINDIRVKKAIRQPFTQFTDSFVNVFCGSAIPLILKTVSPTEQIDNFYSTLLKSIATLIPCCIANVSYDKFLESAVMIAVNSKAPFFSQSFSDYYGANSLFSQHYQTCLRLIAVPHFMLQIDQYFDISINPEIDLHRVFLIFAILSTVYKFLDARNLKEFLQKALERLTTIFDQIMEKDIRNINEKQINNIFGYFQIISSDPNKIRTIEKLQVQFNIKLIKSGLLSKQYNGLKSLRVMLYQSYSSTSIICSILYSESLIDYMLQNMHHELVKDFVFVFREMMKNNRITFDQIKQFWTLFVRQHPSTIDHFSEAWSNFVISMPPAHSLIIVDAIIQTNEYPDSALQLISKRYLKMSKVQSKAIFDRLTEIYISGSQKESNSLILSALPAVTFQSRKFQTEMQNRCLSLIEKKEHVEYALAVLKEILTNLSPESSRLYFDTIINMASIDTSQYLDLITRIVVNIRGLLSEDEFIRLNLITRPLFVSSCEKVIQFYSSLIMSNNITIHMMYTVFKEITAIEEISDIHINFIEFLFARININQMIYDVSNRIVGIRMLSSCGGVSELWSLLFRTGNKKLSNYLVTLYILNHDMGSFYQFIEKCTTRLDCISSLESLILLIHKVEDRINKDFYNIYPNRFLSDNEYNNIYIVGDCSMTIRIAFDISIDAFFNQVAILLNRNRQYLTFRCNDQILTYEDKLEDNMTIEITIHKGSLPVNQQPIQPTSLPSILLLNSQLSLKIYEILCKNDKILSPIALELLSLIPNLNNEVSLLKNPEINWVNFLEKNESPFLFLYRSNMIGNEILCHDSDWFDRFLMTNGATIFLQIVLRNSNDGESYSPNDFVRLMRICKLITEQNHWTSFEPDILSQFSDEELLNSMVQAVLNAESKELISLCLYLLAKVAFYHSDILIKNSALSKLITKTLFHKNSEIRISSKDMIMMFPFETQQSIIFPLLDNLSTSNCNEYFVVLCEIAKTIENINDLWEHLINVFYSKFSLPSTQNPLDKLEFVAPSSDFASGLIGTLIELTKRMEGIQDISKLFWFIIDNIMFNGYKYYPFSADYFSLLTNLTQRDPALIKLLIEKLNLLEIQQVNSSFLPPSPPSSSLASNGIDILFNSCQSERGLRNLGATCYINATLQQFFHIPEVRSAILSANFEENNNSDSNNSSNNNSNNNNSSTDNTDNEANYTDNDNITNVNESVKINNGVSNANNNNQNGKRDKNYQFNNNCSKEDEWIVQLQRVFAHLQYFPTSYIDPSCFVGIWRSWDNELINPHEQQDAVEFLQMFLDRLEAKIPEIAHLFKGEIAHHLVGISSEFSNENVESFITFPLEVKDNDSVSSSFTTFLAPDRFDDYLVEGVGKINAERYSHIRKAPKILILQLKRFEYNLLTNVREKVNDRYVFHSELDLSPVMEDSSSPVLYDLIGIIIHMGSAQGGHYISHVKSDDGFWQTFNDENISQVSKSKLLSSSFGGYDQIDSWDDIYKKTVTTKVAKNGNAYLLFYRKKSIEGDNSSSSLLSASPSQDRMIHTTIINKMILDDLLYDTKSILFHNILLNPSFAKFIMNLNWADIQTSYPFIHRYLLIFIRNIKDFPNLNKLVDKCKTILSKEFASFILTQNNDFYELCLLHPDILIRDVYLSLVEESILHASEESQDLFLKANLTIVLDKGDELMENWKNFDQYFRPFLLLTKRNTETWVPIFFNFLISSVLEYSEIHKQLNILENINLSSIFSILTKVLKQRNIFTGFSAQVFDTTFLISFVQSVAHSKPFLEFVSSFEINPIFVIKTVLDHITSSAAAGFFVMLLNYPNGAEIIIELACTKSPGFIETFLEEVTDRIAPFNGGFGDAVLHFMKPLIIGYLMSQEKTLRMTILEFFEAAQVAPLQLYTLLIGEMTTLADAVDKVAYEITQNNIYYKSYHNYIPTFEYFDLLKKCVVTGNLKQNVIINSKLYISTMKRFGKITLSTNYPRYHLLDFLCETVGSENSEEFFKGASVLTYMDCFAALKSSSDDHVKKSVLNFIPFSASDQFFKHSIYPSMIKFMFVDPVTDKFFKDFILQRIHPGNWSQVTSPLWEKETFKKNMHRDAPNYFLLNCKIIKRFPQASNAFYNTGLVFNSIEAIESNGFSSDPKRSNICPIIAKLLAVFNDSYVTENKGKTSFFKGNFVENLVSFYSRLRVFDIFSITKQVSNGGYCHFLRSVAAISLGVSSQLFNLLIAETGGYIKKVPKAAQKNASKLAAFVFRLNIKNEKAIGLLARELSYLSSAETIEPLCEIIYSLYKNKPAIFSRFEQVCSDFIFRTNDPKIFKSGATRSLLFAVASKNNANVLKWADKAMDLLENTFLSQKQETFEGDVTILLSFITECNKVFGVLPHLIKVPKNLTGRLKAIVLDDNTNALEVLKMLFPCQPR